MSIVLSLTTALIACLSFRFRFLQSRFPLVTLLSKHLRPINSFACKRQILPTFASFHRRQIILLSILMGRISNGQSRCLKEMGGSRCRIPCQRRKSHVLVQSQRGESPPATEAETPGDVLAEDRGKSFLLFDYQRNDGYGLVLLHYLRANYLDLHLLLI